MTLHDVNNIAAGDPARIREEATALGAVCDEIAQVASRLRQVSTHGVWDSGAGETFAAHVGEIPAQLDAVRERLQTGARLLPPYAALLEDAQERLRGLDDRHTQAQRVVHERDRELETLPPEAPDRARLMAERGEAARESFRLQQQFLRESEEILADEKRLAAQLSDVGPELDDPAGYDIFEGLSTFGAGPVVDNPVSDYIRPLKFAAFAHPVGELGHLLVYDEGSATAVATSAARAVLDIVKPPAGVGARVDETIRGIARGREVAAAKAARAAAPSRRGTPGRVGARVRQTTAGAKVRAKHLAQDGFEHATGIRLITNMTSDWAALAAAGPAAKALHIVKYTTASVQQVDSTIRTARTTAETIPPPAGRRQEASRGTQAPAAQAQQDRDRTTACRSGSR